MGFLGPNGAGKTTTIRIVLGLLRASSGSARLFGRECWREAVEERTRLGYLPGDVRLYDGHTGASLLRLLARLRARDSSARTGMLERARELANRLDFDPDKRVRTYSKGNKQKLGLVQAMMHEPEVLILDEPTSALDPLMQERVYELLRERAAAGVSVLFSSHVLSEVEKVCDRVAILRAGRLLEMTAVGDIEQLRWRKVRIESPAADALEVRLEAEGLEVQKEGQLLETLLRGEVDWLVKALAEVPVTSLTIEPLSIEEIFFDSYRAAARQGVEG